MSLGPLLHFFSSPIAIYCRDNRLAILFRAEGGVVQCEEMELPVGIIVSGMIENPARFLEAFRELRGATSGKGKRHGVYNLLIAVTAI